jgi:Galactose mutarotase and related enzymes
MATIKSDRIQVSATTKGAELQSILGPGGVEYLWQGDPAFWARRSPLLFPIVGGLPGGAYFYEGKSFSMGNHGFVREREFRLSSHSEEAMAFELISDEASRALYPFDFALRVSYEARGDELKVGYRVENTGAQAMIFSIGAHPAFRAPIWDGEKRSDFDLVFERDEEVDRWFLNDANLCSGESEPFLRGKSSVPVTDELFERGAIVLKDHVSRKLRLESRASGRFVEVSFPDFPQLGIWSPKRSASGQAAPFVCIEPWFGVMPRSGADPALEGKEATLALDAGKAFEAAYTVRVG